MPRDMPYVEPIGQHPSFRRVLARARHIARCMIAVVLLLGETGTGKEEIAMFIHVMSGVQGSFLAVNCSAFQDTNLEVEMFGSEPGAFTDSKVPRAGLVEAAADGTLFLDEVADMSPAMQVKLLRFIQSREYRRVGGLQNRKARCNIIAATNRNLPEMVRTGAFREDLFFRLKAYPIVVPPLRDRREDIGLLTVALVERLKLPKDYPRPTFEPEVMLWLAGQDWPGNVRDLESFVQRLVILADDGRVDMAIVEQAREMDLDLDDRVQRSEDDNEPVTPLLPEPPHPREEEQGTECQMSVRDRILAVVLPGLTVRESKIWEAAGLTREAGRRTLLQLVERGMLEKADRGAYRRRASRGG